jgi:hypothetical protein
MSQCNARGLACVVLTRFWENDGTGKRIVFPTKEACMKQAASWKNPAADPQKIIKSTACYLAQ